MVAWAVVAVLSGIAAIHLAWALGFRGGHAAVLPEVDGKKTMNPGPGTTLVVVALLLAAAALVGLRGGLWALPGLPAWMAQVGTFGVAAVLTARAVGDFRTMGLFKRVRGTKFARWDDRLFTPLCLALALGAAVVAVAG